MLRPHRLLRESVRRQDLPLPPGAWPAAKKFEPTVLLVDDDAAVRSGLSRVLGAEAIRVAAARGVKDALEHIGRFTPDLVLTDLCMAPLAGWDLIAHLSDRHPGLPIFVITALPLARIGEAVRDIEAYFQKPLNLESMVAAIRWRLNHLYSSCAATLVQL